MKKLFLFSLFILVSIAAWCQVNNSTGSDQISYNKQIALKFYNDLWATNNTEKYAETVADFYLVHDIGARKNITEPAIRQKEIADFFLGKWRLGIHTRFSNSRTRPRNDKMVCRL